MRQFKVVSLSVGGLNNRIFKIGEVVNEDNFPRGNADLLVSDGHLLYFGEEESEQIKNDDDLTLKVQNIIKQIGIDDITRNEIISDLKKRNIDFDKNASKIDLFEIWSK